MIAAGKTQLALAIQRRKPNLRAIPHIYLNMNRLEDALEWMEQASHSSSPPSEIGMARFRFEVARRRDDGSEALVQARRLWDEYRFAPPLERRSAAADDIQS